MGVQKQKEEIMGKARIATKLMGMAYRKVAKIAKRKTKGPKGGKVGGKTPKYKHDGRSSRPREEHFAALNRAERAASRGADAAVAAITLGKKAYPMSISMRSDIKAGVNAVKIMKGQGRGGFPAEKHGNPFTGRHTRIQARRRHSAKAHGRPTPGSNPMGHNPMERPNARDTDVWQNSSAKKALDAYFKKRR